MNFIEEDDSDYEDLSFVDFASCPVCMDRYSLTEGEKTPIILQCHHSLCKACCLLLVDQARVQANHFGYPYLHRQTNVQIINCPVCRKQLQIREGEYPVNFYITKFLEEIKKKRDVGPNLALWCKDCKTVAKEVCRLHSTVKLGDALCNLATNHKYISSTLLEIVSTHIDSSKKAASDSDNSIKKLENSMTELRTFISRIKTFLRVLGTKKQEIYKTFSSCRDAITTSLEITKNCEPFACNSDDLVQDSQTWLQSSKKVDDETLRDRARVVCQSTQIKLVKTLEENIQKLQEQELNISAGKKLQDNFNKEQGQINADFFRCECKRLIDQFKRAFDECFKEIKKIKDINDIPNDRYVPFGRDKDDKPKLLAKELNQSLKYFIELIQAEKGTGSGASKVSTQSHKVSDIDSDYAKLYIRIMENTRKETILENKRQETILENNRQASDPGHTELVKSVIDKTRQASDSGHTELVKPAPFSPDIEITLNDDKVNEPTHVEEEEYEYAHPDYDDVIDDEVTVTTINEISKMAAKFFQETQLERPEMFSNYERPNNNSSNDFGLFSRNTNMNHLLFPNPSDDHHYQPEVNLTEVRGEFDNQMNLDRSDIADNQNDKHIPERRTCATEKRMSEARDHDHVKRPRSSTTNEAYYSHKRRNSKNRKSRYAAEILNISSDTE